ncbi:shootin-1 isoform X2 [Copidosoma floridanum]|nr:shootin-1 isoform X2 [Copidosoma floridanum]XP_014203367.1 shootin-1 isoform X2 [Copidosoma floridanum]XP_014203368.1 shootin-1 isoform X2 [Copidosoma floridanum]
MNRSQHQQVLRHQPNLVVLLPNSSHLHSYNRPPSASSPSASPSHIPVPKSSSPGAQSRPGTFTQERSRSLTNNNTTTTTNNNNNNICNSSHLYQQQHPASENAGGRKSMSVAAQRAAFERLDAQASQQSQPSHTPVKVIGSYQRSPSGTSTPNGIGYCSQRSDSGSTSSVNCTGWAPKSNDSLQEAARWRSKFDEAEKRRKMLLQKSEAVNRDCADLERKYQQLLRQNGTLQTQVQEKTGELEKIRTVSEAVCKEYEQLKRQYDVETGAMHKAMQQASQWYRQNRELKRRSQVITQRYLQTNPEVLEDFLEVSDEVDNQNEDIEQLRESVTELSKEVAKLQTELSAARLQEFEAQEQVTLLTSRLEEEKQARQNEQEKMRELSVQKENLERVTKMVADEVQVLKTQCDREREGARLLKLEADRAQKERSVLAHQSALLMADVGDDPSNRLLVVLQEVESLKRALEEEKQSRASEVQALQDKLEEKESNVEFEIVEEKLKLSESELEMVVQRAERAESTVEDLRQRVAELEEKLVKRTAAPPPPPLPPPPPPPPPMMANGSTSSIKLITRERMAVPGDGDGSALESMENMLGIKKSAPMAQQQPAIDDIINQIKGGRFTLKHTDKQKDEERRRKQEEESKPPAVSEMLNILGTMRRRAKPTRTSFKFSNGPL